MKLLGVKEVSELGPRFVSTLLSSNTEKLC